MGTNYYFILPENKKCPYCGHQELNDEIHIGKSSAGWEFGFHGTDKIRSYNDWLKFFGQNRYGTIKNEYNQELSISDFRKVVEERTGYQDYGLKNHTTEYPSENNWNDDEGYSFSSYEFS